MEAHPSETDYQKIKIKIVVWWRLGSNQSLLTEWRQVSISSRL